MSNISALNLAVSGSTALNGFVTLSAPLLSTEGGNFQGISTTELNTTGSVTHNVLPISNVLPVLSGELTNKGYVDSVNAIQDGKIGALEVKTTNLSFSTNRTTLAGVSTVGGVMTHTVPPVSAVLPTSASQVSNKQYVDNNIQIVNNAVTTLTTRVTATEGVNTTQGTSITAIQGVNTTQSTAITALETRATAIEGVNTTQNSQILTLEEKTSALTYSNPVTGQMTEIASSVSVLPFNNSTSLKSFSLNCNNIICSTQATFGGVGANRGITASQVQVGGFGTPYQTFHFGSVTSVSGTNTVTFSTAMIGTIPKILLTPIGTSTGVVLTNKSLTNFTFTSTGVFNIDWIAIQPL